MDHVKLDSEGGAHAAASNARFLTTTVAVGLGAFSMIGDSGGGDVGHTTAGGAGGYKLIGLAMGLAIRSQPFGMAMGAFGASRSIYANFVARGHDVVFPKNTAMEIGIASRPAGSAPPMTQQSASNNEDAPNPDETLRAAWSWLRQVSGDAAYENYLRPRGQGAQNGRIFG